MPGVKVTTSTSPGPSAAQTAPTATLFVAGQTERGSVLAPTLIHSVSEYLSLLGSRVAYGSVYDSVACYFAEGGTQAYVARVVGPAAAVGQLSLNDRGGTPQPTLRFAAASPGSWSAQLQVQIANGVTANTVDVIVFLNGLQVEKHAALANPAAVIAAFAGSPYVTVTDLHSTNTAPANNPAVLAATALSAGADDATNVTSTLLLAALSQFVLGLGSGMVAIPGQSATTVGAGLIAHCQQTTRVCCLAPSPGTSTASAKSDAATLRALNGGEYAMYAWPWVQIADGAGGVLTVPPEGFVAGVRARTLVNVGPWQEPIGEFGRSRFCIGTEQTLDYTTNNDLYDNNVSGIRILLSSVRLYGYRSMSADTVNYKLLRDRDLLNYVAIACAEALEPLVGGTIDGKGQFFDRCKNAALSVVEPLAIAGGLYPMFASDGISQVDPGYVIDTGPDVNPANQLRQDVAGIAVAVRPSPQADTINVSVTKVAVGTTI